MFRNKKESQMCNQTSLESHVLCWNILAQLLVALKATQKSSTEMNYSHLHTKNFYNIATLISSNRQDVSVIICLLFPCLLWFCNVFTQTSRWRSCVTVPRDPSPYHVLEIDASDILPPCWATTGARLRQMRASNYLRGVSIAGIHYMKDTRSSRTPYCSNKRINSNTAAAVE